MHRCEYLAGPLVSPLRGCVCPPDVTGRVRTIVVDTIEGVTGRSGSEHSVQVSQKWARIVSPFGRYSDSTAAVVGVRGVLRIVAAINHVVPSMVARMAGKSMRSPIQDIGLLPGFRESLSHGVTTFSTTAGLRSVLPSKRLSEHGYRGSTVAPTDRRTTVRSATVERCQFNDFQSAESIADDKHTLSLHRLGV